MRWDEVKWQTRTLASARQNVTSIFGAPGGKEAWRNWLSGQSCLEKGGEIKRSFGEMEGVTTFFKY